MWTAKPKGVQALLFLLWLFVVAVVVFVPVLFVYYLMDSLSCDRNMAAKQPFYMFFPNRLCYILYFTLRI
jgi:hypothetical protein